MVLIMEYPQDTIPDWSNLKIIHRNTLPPRSSFFLYNTEDEALNYDTTKSKSLCLSGPWKFLLAPSPLGAPPDFHLPAFDSSPWQTIQVPSMWQLEPNVKGKSRGPQYTNVMYPFPVNPPNIPLEGNETGCYLKTFVVPEELKKGKVRVRFEGVDSAFTLWVNGVEVGYSQGSRNPSEFEIGELLRFGGWNTIAVQVYQWCDGSYIEDQDQWWLSGIFRDVYLLAFPETHFEDFHVQTLLDDDYRNAALSVKIQVSGGAEVLLKLLDSSKNVVVKESKSASNGLIHFKIPIKDPYKWTAETPYLYHLVLSFVDGEQVIAQRIGFRKTEIKDGLFLVNGKRVVFRGANRHEHHPEKGRAVPYDFLKNDLLMMKAHNINAIRTCHQPNNPRLYDLADELGLWIIDEADLECHGFAEVMEVAMTDEQKRLGHDEKQKISYEGASKWLTDNPEWKEAYEDRARQLVMRDKNHPSVTMWSLGNESFYGRNIQSMYDLIKSIDPSRPIHYEGDREAKTVDLFSMMYASVSKIVEFAKEKDYTKPLILCEYIHAMGNGPGAIKEYVEAFYEYPRLQGGFVWEWANHGLLTKNEEGEDYYGYGGDFGEEVHDSNFVMDGVLFSNHTPTPGLTEYKKAIEPVQVKGILRDPLRVELVNRYDFLKLDHLACNYSLVGDGFEQSIGKLLLPKGIRPGKTAKISIDGLDLTKAALSDTYLTVSFVLKNDHLWAKAGHEVAWGQVKTADPAKSDLSLRSLTMHKQAISIKKISSNVLSIANQESAWKFDTTRGIITSWIKSCTPETELLTQPPILDFYRALTDNDAPRAGVLWKEKRLHQTKYHLKSITYTNENGNFIITTQTRIAPPVLEWCVDTTTTFAFNHTSLQIHVSGIPSGINLPRTFARIGYTFSFNPLFKNVKWFGRGPGESYIDKKESQRFGNWDMPIKDLWVPYEFPQESGNRTDVRHVTFSGINGDGEEISAKMNFGNQEGCSFSASHYRVEDVDAARHPFELEKKRKEEVIVRLDWRHMGLGTGSCGPDCLPQYELRSEPFEFDLWFE